MTLKGKVAVVTGSGGVGCGGTIAQRLAREGMAVVVSDIDRERGEEVRRRIEQSGGNAAFRAADVRVEEEVRGLIGFAERTFGALHVLVNNASAPFRPGEPLDHWQDTVQTDLLGTMYATRAAIDALRRSGGGAIVNISSISALWHGRPLHNASPSYEVAKAGVIRLTTGLVWLRASAGIRVNCLAPGWIAVPEVVSYWEKLTPEERKERSVPSRLLETSQIADAVVRLATDESLAGRVLVWWSEDEPGLIPWADRGYTALERLEPLR
jgi:NAD(P)-dependent dehydrogenase (short-subunit alcohol dehydrogenase family)